MQLIYEGKDITKDIEIRKADLTDNAGGELDSLEVWINDTKGLWSKWKPEKNHTIQVKHQGFDSGVMYIDELGQRRGAVTFKALPVKQEAKTPRTKAWDNVRFMEFTQEISNRLGLTLVTYGIDNYLYSRVDQYEESDPKFLSKRCILEGYALKLTGGKMVIYSEKYMESQVPVKRITPDDIDGDFNYKDKSSGVYGSCKITNKPYEFKAPKAYGPILKINDVMADSLGEAERFSKGLLRSVNKFEKTLPFELRLDPKVAAGNMVTAINFGLADGNYFAYQIIHRFVEEKTVLKLRKALEGY